VKAKKQFSRFLIFFVFIVDYIKEKARFCCFFFLPVEYFFANGGKTGKK
jgi:hypothetical protein